jgi:hypothetical protein
MRFLLALLVLSFAAAVLRAAADEIDPDCRYLEVGVVTPLGLDDRLQAPFREMFETHLDRVGFRPVDARDLERRLPTWVAHTQVLMLPDRSVVWSYRMRKIASIAGGEISLEKFSDPSKPGLKERFGEIGAIKHTTEARFGDEAMKAARWAADVYLERAHELCRDLDATSREEEARLVRVRDQLRDEIERVREERAIRQRRSLELEVEPGP